MLFIKDLNSTLKRIKKSVPLQDGEEKVTCYGYRKSRVAGKTIATLPRQLMTDFELCLAAVAGVDPDNHTGYVVEVGSNTMFVYCTDDHMILATDYALGDY